MENEQPTISDAVSMVKHYGGITSLAHPKNYAVPTEILLKSLKRSGVDACILRFTAFQFRPLTAMFTDMNYSLRLGYRD